MSILGIDLNDAELTGFADGALLFSEPGYALAPDGKLLFGWEAWHAARRFPRRVHNRYWLELADSPLPMPMASASTCADLVHDHLAALWKRCDADYQAVVFAVPGHWSSSQLGLLLGIAAELAIPVAGLIDASVAATRREYPGRELLCIDASLHGITLTRVSQTGRAAVLARETLAGLGIDALERASVEWLAAAFLKSARFDPLHDADSEQRLYDHLQDWLRQLETGKRLELSLEHAGRRFSSGVERAGLAARLADLWQPLLQRLRSLLPVGSPAAIQLPARLSIFPGLAEALAELPGAEVFVLEPGAAARGACRPNLRSAPGQSLRLITSLAWDQPAAALAPGQAPVSGGSRQPTHLLIGERAFRLDERPFSIGTELSAGDRGYVVDAAIAGVSRQHCSIRREQGRLLLTDHSRFGTRLNGHPIDGSAVLQAGDVISLGAPPCEFRLIAEAQEHGA